MKAIIEAIYLLKKDRPLAIRVIKKYIRVNDEEAGIGYWCAKGLHDLS